MAAGLTSLVRHLRAGARRGRRRHAAGGPDAPMICAWRCADLGLDEVARTDREIDRRPGLGSGPLDPQGSRRAIQGPMAPGHRRQLRIADRRGLGAEGLARGRRKDDRKRSRHRRRPGEGGSRARDRRGRRLGGRARAAGDRGRSDRRAASRAARRGNRGAGRGDGARSGDRRAHGCCPPAESERRAALSALRRVRGRSSRISLVETNPRRGRTDPAGGIEETAERDRRGGRRDRATDRRAPGETANARRWQQSDLDVRRGARAAHCHTCSRRSIGRQRRSDARGGRDRGGPAARVPAKARGRRAARQDRVNDQVLDILARGRAARQETRPRPRRVQHGHVEIADRRGRHGRRSRSSRTWR